MCGACWVGYSVLRGEARGVQTANGNIFRVTRKKRRLVMRRLKDCRRKHLVGHEDGVDDVNDTVRLEDIGGSDGGHAAFGVGQHDVAA